MLEFILKKEIVAPVIIVAVCTIIWLILKKVINQIFNRKIKKVDSKKQNTIKGLISNIVKIFIILIALLMILDIYGIDTASLIASLGVVGLVVGLALQDLLKDFIVGMTIIFENQFCVGDIVTINGFKGEVIQLTMKSTRLKSATGEVMILANRMITDVINHTIENSLAIVDLEVSYTADLDKTEKILKDACIKLKEDIKEVTGNIDCVGVQSLNASSITFRIVAETMPMQQFGVERLLKKELKKVLDKNKIEIPYPQVVIHNERV